MLIIRESRILLQSSFVLLSKISRTKLKPLQVDDGRTATDADEGTKKGEEKETTNGLGKSAPHHPLYRRNTPNNCAIYMQHCNNIYYTFFSIVLTATTNY